MCHSLLPLILVLAYAAASGSNYVHAEELTQGAMLGNSCAGCHGTDGKSPGSIPTIAGKSAVFIESALRDFRADMRASTVMNRHAKAYTDEEIRLIAEFFAGPEQE